MDPDIVVVIILIVSGGGGGSSSDGGGVGGVVAEATKAFEGACLVRSTIIDVVPIAWMIVVVGDGDGDGGGGNGGGGGDSCLQRRAGWRRRFCGDCHAVKI